MDTSADIENKPSVQIEEEVLSDNKLGNTLPPPDPIDVEAESRLKWKIDLLILPLLTGFYFFQSMVCSNPLSYTFSSYLFFFVNPFMAISNR